MGNIPDKTCFKCNESKPLTEFYKHARMSDGHLNKCKICTRKDTKTRTNVLSQDKDWIDKEKARHREKYYRLGYKEKHKPNPEEKAKAMLEYKDKYPEKKRALNRSSHLRRRLEITSNYHIHHWSYREGDEKDVIILKKQDHYLAHRFLKYDKEQMLYRTLEDVLLDTNLKHYRYIEKIIVENREK